MGQTGLTVIRRGFCGNCGYFTVLVCSWLSFFLVGYPIVLHDVNSIVFALYSLFWVVVFVYGLL